jgi:nitroreductase
LIAALLSRRSIGPRGLRDPGPSPEQWQAAANAALRAPDHQGLRPFRFVHVGRDERLALAALFAAAAVEQGRDDEGVRQAQERAHTGPGLLAVVACIHDDVPEVPPHEQWITVGAAVMNLLNALHAMGFGAKALGGSMARSRAVTRAFCHPGEQVACWVIAGTPEASDPPLGRHARNLLLDWSPPIDAAG